ncbi:MAG: 2OG-Fe(II) oxygenase [Hyphomicrobiales bacterium]|nr:2OG-Fe(II) oxygenase [Hyphomicrobiales bacterium]
MSSTSEDVVSSFLKSIDEGQRADAPYPHWFLRGCLPEDTVDDINALPFEAPDLGGVSGKRELHNATRTYLDVEARENYPAARAFTEAFQDKRVTDRIAKTFGTDLDGSLLRIEYAQDIDGFWLEPHTDLGVKLFTMLLYMSKDESHHDLGTDIYDADKTPVGRSPFEANAAMVFVPSDVTYHGFEPRPIDGVRKSIIINYVTDAWRAREQLAFPNDPIRG